MREQRGRHEVVIVFTFVARKGRSPLVENDAARQKASYVRRTECMERHTISAFPPGQLSPESHPVVSKLFKPPGGFQLIKLKSTVVFLIPSP